MQSETPTISVRVNTQYLEGKIPPEENKYAFAYRIAIENNSDKKVKLINRYWLITNADGEKTEVRGPGVVGEQPVIEAGQSFQYTSGAILETPVGTMEGYYEMEDYEGKLFKVPIAVFSLAVPNLIN